jgi:hypothetical protein
MNYSDGKTGSVRVSTTAEGLETLDYEDEIVLYDTGLLARQAGDGPPILEAHGYERGRRYTGGLEKGESAGYPLEANTPDNRTTVFAPSAHEQPV